MKLTEKAVERLHSEDEQRQAVRYRSFGQCEFEVVFDRIYQKVGATRIVTFNGWQEKAVSDGAGRLWVRCNKPAGQTCHIYRRWKCTEETRFDARLALNGCDRCHKRFDDYALDVRVRPDILRAAWDLIIYDASIGGHQARVEALVALGPRP